MHHSPTQRSDVRGRVTFGIRTQAFIALHCVCALAPIVGTSRPALAAALTLFLVRSFAITGFYHRYFAHRAFRTSRAVQLVFAILGAAAAQRGPLWWAANHRSHHAHSDTGSDPHSPVVHGFAWSHTLWFLCGTARDAREGQLRDFERFPELRWLDRHDMAVPALLAGLLFGLGHALAIWVPGAGTDGLQMLVWGFAISTVTLYHVTFSVNSVCHRFGTRRYPTRDQSRNNAWLALPTFGEAWHNNHHYYPRSARQGFYWWEIDLTYYGLWLFSRLGLVWDLRPVPEKVRNRRTPR